MLRSGPGNALRKFICHLYISPKPSHASTRWSPSKVAYEEEARHPIPSLNWDIIECVAIEVGRRYEFCASCKPSIRHFHMASGHKDTAVFDVIIKPTGSRAWCSSSEMHQRKAFRMCRRIRLRASSAFVTSVLLVAATSPQLTADFAVADMPSCAVLKHHYVPISREPKTKHSVGVLHMLLDLFVRDFPEKLFPKEPRPGAPSSPIASRRKAWKRKLIGKRFPGA